MKQFIQNVMQSPVKLGAGLVLAASVLAPLIASAWGPNSRPTFTTQKPATYVTFNSMTNNPRHGDERNFVQIKDKNASDASYVEKINIKEGKQYTVFMYFHNNADEGLNLIARNTRARVQLPKLAKAGQDTRITGFISADNAQPGQVWDEVYVKADKNLTIQYIPDSAKIVSKGAVNGKTLSNELFSNGALLGYYSLNGEVPGCHNYAGYLTFDFRVIGDTAPKPDFTVEKVVAPFGSNNFSKSIKVKTGDKVDFRIGYKNTGNVEQAKVVVKDTLPAGLELVPNSVMLANKNTSGKYTKLPNNLTSNGQEIGTYEPNANAYIQFTAKVTKTIDNCAPAQTLTNSVAVITAHGQKSDRASVVVEGNCQVKQIQVCELATKQLVTIKEADFNNTKHSKNLDDCKVTPTPQIQVCELSTKKIITINQTAFNSSLHSKNLDDCKKPSIPIELPKTGFGLDSLTSLIGLTSLVASLGYYINSRKLA